MSWSRATRLYLEAIQELQTLAKYRDCYSWGNPESLGIDYDSWKQIEGRINPIFVFLHPKLLVERPRVLVYYRRVSLLSRKSLNMLVGGNIAAIEAGKQEFFHHEWTSRVVVALNGYLSAVVRMAVDMNVWPFPGFQFAAAGTTIQGSWNNAIGSEGVRAVKTLVVNNLKDEMLQIGWRAGGTMDYSPPQHAQLIDRLGDVRVVRLTEGFSLLFGSEPDISLRDAKGVPRVAIEIKAGADPAAALKRLGAAMKSFENDRALNPRVKTVYVVHCMTPELRDRIDQMKPFDFTFGLADLLVDQRTQKRFASIIIKHLVDRR